MHFSFFQSRDIDRRQPNKVREANLYYFTEASIALFVSFVINVFVVSVFAHGLFGKTNADVVSKNITPKFILVTLYSITFSFRFKYMSRNTKIFQSISSMNFAK